VIRVRWTFEKNERYRHLELPDDLFEATLATLPPREDRNLQAPLFPDLNDAALRTAITRACKATGTPHFSPHGLRWWAAPASDHESDPPFWSCRLPFTEFLAGCLAQCVRFR
jgi:integrase